MVQSLRTTLQRMSHVSLDKERPSAAAKEARGNKAQLGSQSDNPLLEQAAIRLLPAETKARIVQLSHPKQSVTALFATLYQPARLEGQSSALPGVRTQGGGAVTVFDTMNEGGTPAMPMTVTELAKKIGRSTHPNKQRDLMSIQREGQFTLHPDITLRSANAHFSEPTPFEREQCDVLLNTDFSDLEKLGKVSISKENRINYAMEDAILLTGRDEHLNDQDTFAPSTSAAADALLLGLTARLTQLKGDPDYVLRTVFRATKLQHPVNVASGVTIRTGASFEARYAALHDVLKENGSFKRNPEDQEAALHFLALFGKSIAIAPGRSPVQGKMLDDLLRYLRVKPKKEDLYNFNMFRFMEKSDAWLSLLKFAPDLHKGSQKKIYEAFLADIDNSTLLDDMDPSSFRLAQSHHLLPGGATGVTDIYDARSTMEDVFTQLGTNLPSVQDRKLAGRLADCHQRYQSRMLEALQDRAEHG